MSLLFILWKLLLAFSFNSVTAIKHRVEHSCQGKFCNASQNIIENTNEQNFNALEFFP